MNEFESSGDQIVSNCSRKIKDPKFKWDTGFRIGVGQHFAICWDATLYWTHFHTSAHGRQKGKQPCDCSCSDFSSQAHRSLQWKLEYNTVDLTVGHNFFFLCYRLNLKPCLGLRGAWINQKLHAHEENGCCISNENDSFRCLEKNKQKFKGIGPFLGLQTDWDIGCNFSVFGKVDIGFLYGKFDVSSGQFSEFENEANCSNIEKNIHACEAFADVALGLRWEYCFCNGIFLKLAISGEHHQYFDQKRFGDKEDLCIDGATFSACIEF